MMPSLLDSDCLKTRYWFPLPIVMNEDGELSTYTTSPVTGSTLVVTSALTLLLLLLLLLMLSLMASLMLSTLLLMLFAILPAISSVSSSRLMSLPRSMLISTFCSLRVVLAPGCSMV
jgi:hypothetical protein